MNILNKKSNTRLSFTISCVKVGLILAESVCCVAVCCLGYRWILLHLAIVHTILKYDLPRQPAYF